MKTISSSSTSLIYWKQTENKSNISITGFNGNELVLKPVYHDVFASIASELKSTKCTKLIPLWQKTMSEAEAKLRQLMANAILNHSSKDADSIDRVVFKFRGNCGEIFAEKLFTSGLAADVCKLGSYVPVDPHHEEGIDATGISPVSNMKIGIQVKNFSEKNKVKLEVFRTAGDESDKIVHSLENAEQVLAYLKCPGQIIFSFTNADKILVESYKNRVMFLGPDYIESKKLCGMPGSSCGNWTFFQDIADEINSII